MNPTPRDLVLIVTLLGAASALARNQARPAGPMQASLVTRAASPIRVDGVLDELAWQKAWSMDLAYEVSPGENVPPPVRTQLLVTYDDRAAYFAFRAFDPDPKAIRAHLSDRDNIGSDDWVAVVLDTFNDERRAFALKVNPLGVQGDFVDLAVSEEAWDAIWDTSARITDWGWAAEMRVPFSSLRFQRTSEAQVWGIDAVRSYPRLRRHAIGLFPRDRSNNCYFCQAVKITGFEGVTPGANLEVTPTLTGTRTDTRADFPGGKMHPGSTDSDLGATARWGVTPNLTLVGTLNPDFSQVESDALQLDVNEPFALSYPEKRPFFMEGSDFFATNLNAVYTRMVRDPKWGAKLSGKEEGNTVGAYVVRDEVTNILVPGRQSSAAASLDQPSTASVLRYKRDLGSRFTLAGLVTDREGDAYHNRLAGFDLDLRFTDTDRLQVQLLGSSTRYPGDVADATGQSRDELRDWAGDIEFTHRTRTWEYWGLYQDIGPGFRADLGFMPRVDLRLGEAGVDYTWNPEGPTWYTNFNVGGWVRDARDHQGDLLYREGVFQLYYEGPLQSHAVARYTRRQETYNGQRFDRNEVYLHNCMAPNRSLDFFINVYSGDQIDYANTRPGKRIRVVPGVTQRFGRHLSVSLSGTWERMREQRERLFTATIAETSVAYQFTARAFVRAILQYMDYDYNTALYTDGRDARSKGLFSQYLFSYKLNPQTVLFIGYSDAAEGNQDVRLTRANRTVFAKIGYAWVI
ncbi:MAG TPA: DUF5916 domain-containing protein [Thermoanaerobaculaceae bacterium]|nr:DUF5916 domain-containing protein [Thermoanaerobaculaceae bacterium]